MARNKTARKKIIHKANRVKAKARNKKVRKKIIHKESQHFQAQKENNASSPEPCSIEY